MHAPMNMLCRALVALVVATALIAGFAPPADACSSANAFMGTICVFAFGSCPVGWAAADGKILPIAQNTALFALLGTTYGGNGQTTFALPDLRGRGIRAPGKGPGLSQVDLGQVDGVDDLAVKVDNLPPHTHTLFATNSLGDATLPGANVLARDNPDDGTFFTYNAAEAAAPVVVFAPGSVGTTGLGQPLDIRFPYLALTICINTTGAFPKPN